MLISGRVAPCGGRTLVISLVLVVLVALCGSMPRAQAQGALVRDTIIVADISGSMDGGHPGTPGVKKITTVKKAAEELLRNNPIVVKSTGDFALITFGGGCAPGNVTFTAWTANAPAYAGSIRQTINNTIQAITPSGNTPLDRAIDLLRTLIDDRHKITKNRGFSVVIYTDGRPTCNELHPKKTDVKSALEEAAKLGKLFKKLGSELTAAINNPPPARLLIQVLVTFISSKPKSPDSEDLQFGQQFVAAINESAGFDAAKLLPAATADEVEAKLTLALTQAIDPTVESIASCGRVADRLLICASIDDDQEGQSYGDGNGVINSGEDIEIGFVVRNISTESITGLRIESELVQPVDPAIRVQEGSSTGQALGDLEAGESVVADPASGDLDLSIDLFAETRITFTVKVTLFSEDRELGSATFEFRIDAESHF
ncbi:MAG: VWA domain-containing protein [Candidatus Bipolaricaulia bacterium]